MRERSFWLITRQIVSRMSTVCVGQNFPVVHTRLEVHELTLLVRKIQKRAKISVMQVRAVKVPRRAVCGEAKDGTGIHKPGQDAMLESTIRDISSLAHIKAKKSTAGRRVEAAELDGNGGVERVEHTRDGALRARHDVLIVHELVHAEREAMVVHAPLCAPGHL